VMMRVLDRKLLRDLARLTRRVIALVGRGPRVRRAGSSGCSRCSRPLVVPDRAIGAGRAVPSAKHAGGAIRREVQLD
jgi:hypothetical protein